MMDEEGGGATARADARKVFNKSNQSESLVLVCAVLRHIFLCKQ